MLSDDENIKRARHQARENAKKFGNSSVSNFGSKSNYGNSSNYNNNSSSGYYDSYEPSPSRANNKKPTSSGGLGGWDGVADDDDGTGGVTKTQKDEEPDFFGTTNVTSNVVEPEVDFFNSTNGFEPDWNQAPSSNNAPRAVSEESEPANNFSSAMANPKATKRSVPRKLVSLGAAVNYSGNAPSGSSNVDLLGGLGTATNAVPAGNNDWDPFSGSAPKAEIKNTTQAADPFGDWMSTPSTTNDQTTSNSNNLNDLFSNLSTNQSQTTNSIPANLSGLLNPVTNNSPQQPKSSAQTSKKIQASSTWAGIDNLDSLVNMSNISQPKKQSMNSMMSSNSTISKSSVMTPSSNIMTPSNILTPTGANPTEKKKAADDQFMGFF